jgi:hypothetical protein
VVAHEVFKRHAPFVLSLLVGMAIWEIAGRNASPAFLVPLSETLLRTLSSGPAFWPTSSKRSPEKPSNRAV